MEAALPALTPTDALANRALTPPVPSKNKAAMRKGAEQFEAVFLSEMFNFMEAGLPTDGPFGGGEGEGMVRSLLTDQYAKAVAARGGIGIADKVYRELLAYQEGGAHAGPKSH